MLSHLLTRTADGKRIRRERKKSFSGAAKKKTRGVIPRACEMRVNVWKGI
jgi:hypothetical protein